MALVWNHTCSISEAGLDNTGQCSPFVMAWSAGPHSQRVLPPSTVLSTVLGARCSPPRFFSGNLAPNPASLFSPDCKFTCHPECRHLIQLDCSQQQGPLRDRPSPDCTLTPTAGQVGSKAGAPGWEQLSQEVWCTGGGMSIAPVPDVGVPFWPGDQTYILILLDVHRMFISFPGVFFSDMWILPHLLFPHIPPKQFSETSCVPHSSIHSLRPLTFRCPLQVQVVPWASDLPAIDWRFRISFLGFV